MRRLACITAALLCLSAVAFADEASNRDAATRDAAEAVTLLRLPDGAQRVDENPAADPATLAQPGVGVSSSPNQVGQSEFWRVPGNPWDVFAWLKQHPPADTRIAVTGGGGDRGGQTLWSVAFQRRPIREVMRDRDLVISLSRASGGGTAVRADGVATWLVPRPASEQIPGGSDLLRVTIRGMKPAPVVRFSVRDAERIRLVTRMLNRLPLGQPAVFLCPLDRGIRADLAFTRGGSELARAVAALGGCADVQLTLAGQDQPALNGYGVFGDLEAILGWRIDLAPFIDSDFTPEVMPVARVAHGSFHGVPFDAVAYNGGPRSGICVELFLAGVNRSGAGCLLHLRGKRTTTVLGPECYPRELTAFAVIGRRAARTRVRFDDGKSLLGKAITLAHATVTTTIGLESDHIVKLKRPAKVELGYRGPFAFGVRPGMHPVDGGFSLLDYC